MSNFLLGGSGTPSTASQTLATVKTVASFVPVLGQVVNVANTLGGVIGIKTSKDPGRLAANAKAYGEAISGNRGPFLGTDGKYAAETPLGFLLMKSPSAMGGQGGWATDKAQQDAWEKYKAAKSILESPNQNANVPGSSVLASFNMAGKSNQYVVVGGLILAMLFIVRKR